MNATRKYYEQILASGARVLEEFERETENAYRTNCGFLGSSEYNDAPFMKTLIYYYCLLRYNEPIEMDNVNLEDSEIDPEEYREPFMQKLPKRKRFGPGVSMPRAMKLSKMGLVKVSEPLVRCMRIDEKELMAWCRQHDATPNVAIAIMMNRAIHKLHPDSKLPIGASVSCDLRTTLNAPKSHWSLIFRNKLLSTRSRIIPCRRAPCPRTPPVPRLDGHPRYPGSG